MYRSTVVEYGMLKFASWLNCVCVTVCVCVRVCVCRCVGVFVCEAICIAARNINSNNIILYIYLLCISTLLNPECVHLCVSLSSPFKRINTGSLFLSIYNFSSGI